MDGLRYKHRILIFFPETPVGKYFDLNYKGYSLADIGN